MANTIAQGPFNLVAGQTLSLAPPSNVRWAGAVITNLSPFPTQANTVAQGTAWIDPFTSVWVAIDANQSPIQLIPAAYSSPITNAQVQVTWWDTPAPGTYPVALQTIASTISTPDVVLLPPTALTANPSSTTPITVPTLAAIHALGFYVNGPVAGTYRGLLVAIAGAVAGNYYQRRPLANADTSALHFEIVPVSNAIDTSLSLVLTATGGLSGATFGLVGFTGTPPPYTPPLIPVLFASAANASTNVTTQILPALTDGRSYLLQTLSAAGGATAAFPQIYASASGGANLMTQGATSLNFAPNGLNIGSAGLSVLAGSTTQQAVGTCTYSYV